MAGPTFARGLPRWGWCEVRAVLRQVTDGPAHHPGDLRPRGVVAGPEVQPRARLARPAAVVPAKDLVAVGGLYEVVETAAGRHVVEVRGRRRGESLPVRS